MTYTSFCDALRAALSSHLDSQTSISMHTIQKNNNVSMEAICVHLPDSFCAPLIYVEPLYAEYQSGSPIEEICQSILQTIQQHMPDSRDFLNSIGDFDQMKDRICWRLISQKHNQELLKTIPWIPFLDLAITFFLSLDLDKQGERLTSIRIHNKLKELWDVSPEALLLAAKENMPRLFPPRLRRLETLLGNYMEALGLPRGILPTSELHVLTNETGVYGSACLLYENIIKDFADQMESDILVLPSSVHEVLLLPDRFFFSHGFIQTIIRNVNLNAVSEEERLSDSLYIFRRSSGAVTLWSPAPSLDRPSQGETPNP